MTNCKFHEMTPAERSVSVKGVVLSVCVPCYDRIMAEWVCKFCGVPIISGSDFRAVKGNHKNGCVRRMAE